MHQATSLDHLRSVAFILNRSTSIFSTPYSDVWTMNMFTDMECRLIAKHNLPQKSFVIVDLIKYICSKRKSSGSILWFNSVQQLQSVTRKTQMFLHHLVNCYLAEMQLSSSSTH
ncbi:hypothetical protein NPIL_240011 [Nephila pilipes]|uniref:Uncharacterized protein n=1 Tax=Nephila pilipes TaxID=299642 RepID=A0A8X6U1V9_NEPPI|nr:hypothetical protein NPIL_240011 [Nephila pilipes]